VPKHRPKKSVFAAGKTGEPSSPRREAVSPRVRYLDFEEFLRERFRNPQPEGRKPVVEKAEKKLSRAEQKARRPQEILEAALEEFIEHGYAATRIEDVAARLGVTKGTVYLYFPTKSILFKAVSRHASTPFEDLRVAAETIKGSHADRLRALLLLAYETIAGDRRTREMLRLSLAEGARFPDIVDWHYDEFIAPLNDAVRRLVEQGIASGEFRQGPSANRPDVVASSILHLTVLRLMLADRRPLDEPAFIEAHIDLVLNGLLQG